MQAPTIKLNAAIDVCREKQFFAVTTNSFEIKLHI